MIITLHLAKQILSGFRTSFVSELNSNIRCEEQPSSTNHCDAVYIRAKVGDREGSVRRLFGSISLEEVR